MYFQIAQRRRLDGQSDDPLAGGLGGEMVEKLIFRAAAHDVQLFIGTLRVSFQLRKGFRVALRKAAVGTAEIVADADELSAGRRVKGGLHALGSEKFRRVGVDEDTAGAFLGGVHDLRKAQPAAKLLLQLVDQPHAHDVLLVAVIAHAALVGVIGGAAGLVRDGFRGFDAQK